MYLTLTILRTKCRFVTTIAFAFAILIASSAAARADMVNNDVFLQGNYIEIGMSAKGWFGSGENAPVGFHPIGRTTLGFVSDYEKDGWGTATPGQQNQSGDYFLPGGPFQGFGVEWEASANVRNFNNMNPTFQIIDSIVTADSSAGATREATWSGKAVQAAGVEELKVDRQISFAADDTYFVIAVTLTNTGATTLESLEYIESVDPDQEWDINGNFATVQEIVFQADENADDKVLVSAKGPLYPGMFLGLGAVDARAVAAYGAPLNDPDAVFAAGLVQGSTEQGDRRIALAFRLGDLAAGESVSLTYGYLLNVADLDNFIIRITPIDPIDPIAPIDPPTPTDPVQPPIAVPSDSGGCFFGSGD